MGMPSLRLVPVLAISASLAVFSGCAVEEIHVPGSSGTSANPEVGDPLDSAPEGEPICTREGWCWDFPYTPSSFAALHASAPNALWAVGTNGTILRSHSRGDAWRMMPTGVMSDLHGVFATDHHHAWAVGADGMLLAFDGTKWTRVPAPVESTAILRSVWAASATDVWVVGSENDPKSEREIGILLHFDGTKWSRLSNPFPPLYVVHGKDKEVWIAGGSSESPRVMRYDGLAFTDVDTLALAGSRSVYGPAIGLWVNSRYDVLLTSGQLNTSTVAHYTGEWTVEQSQLRDRSPLGGFGRGPDGSPLVVGNPPLKSDGAGKWVPISETKTYAGVSAIWAVDEEVTVMAGRDGLLDTNGNAPVRPGAIMSTNLDAPWVLSDTGVFRFDATARKWTRSIGPTEEYNWIESFVDAVQVADNDILVVSILYPYDDYDGQIKPKYRTRQWDGTKWTTGALPDSWSYSRGTVTKTKAGHLWIVNSGSVIHRGPGSVDIPVGKCAGDTASTPSGNYLWSAGDDVFLYGYRGIYRFDAAGACTFTAINGLLSDKESFVMAAGNAPNDLWLVSTSTDAEGKSTSNVYRYEGSSWKKTSLKTSQEIDFVRVLPNDAGIFAFGKKSLMTWNGTSLVDVETGLHEKESGLIGMWGKTASEAKFLGPGGRILARKKTN